MTYNNKRLMKMAKKNLESGLGQRMNEIEALLDPDNTKRTLDISPKVIDQYSQMSQKLGIYKKLNDYINSLPLDSIKDLLKNPIFDNRTFKEGAYDMSTELEGMLNLYHFFRPMIYGHSKITNYVFEVTTKIGAVKMIDKALMDIICSVDNLQQSKQDVNNLPPQMVKKEEEQRIPLGNLTNIVKNENASDLLVNQYMSTAFGGSSVKQEENI